MDNIRIVYVRRDGGVFRVVRFVLVVRSCSTEKSILFIKYFKGMASVLRILLRKNPLVLDIRTGSIDANPWKRLYQDFFLKCEAAWFKNITVISESLANRLDIADRVTILPLGAESISQTEKNFVSLKLLYVGTLYNRQIEKAILGFAQFYRIKSNNMPMKFTIIGSGPDRDEENLRNLVRSLNLDRVIQLKGSIPHDQLQQYFDSHNIGVSYIPMTKYYDVQPATKTFEYLLSGMAVIATATSENKLVINNSNGVLVGDAPENFADGLTRLVKMLPLYDSRQIRKNSMQFNWKKITDHLDSYLSNIMLESHENSPRQ